MRQKYNIIYRQRVKPSSTSRIMKKVPTLTVFLEKIHSLRQLAGTEERKTHYYLTTVNASKCCVLPGQYLQTQCSTLIIFHYIIREPLKTRLNVGDVCTVCLITKSVYVIQYFVGELFSFYMCRFDNTSHSPQRHWHFFLQDNMSLLRVITGHHFSFFSSLRMNAECPKPVTGFFTLTWFLDYFWIMAQRAVPMT